jgi:BirA family biotin operon repressor/biotin-[acetyl-CoA-carboxylase] ligase
VSPAEWRLPNGFTLDQRGVVTSTNDEVRDLADAGAASGTIVVAREQTRGRGRHGRSWASPPGNLYVSVLLRPHCSIAKSVELSFLTSLSLAEAIDSLGPKPKLKWPNDVLIDGAKVAGILLEADADPSGQCALVIIGTGVNIAVAPADAPYAVTSLARCGVQGVTPYDLLHRYIDRLAIWLDRWQAEGFPVVRQAWQERSFGLGQPIRLRLRQEEIEGRFVDLSDRGALVIEETNGRRHEIAAGDVFYLDSR